jgi:hypothetical protein
MYLISCNVRTRQCTKAIANKQVKNKLNYSRKELDPKQTKKLKYRGTWGAKGLSELTNWRSFNKTNKIS